MTNRKLAYLGDLYEYKSAMKVLKVLVGVLLPCLAGIGLLGQTNKSYVTR